jgi:ABC-2 type transport system ATP-binding protein
VTLSVAGREPAGLEEAGAAIETRDLVVRYGRKRAVDGLSLSVPRGSVYAFLGPNGAGKTTTIKALLGLRRPSGGEARVLGHDVTDPKGSIEARARVGFASEIDSLYGSMTVPRLCRLCRDLSRRWDGALVERYLGVFGVPEDARVRKLSKGQRAQLQLCLALGSDPELLILDEPTSGLDPVARRTFLKVLVGEVAAGGRTVFFSTHLLSDIEAVADTVGIVKDGRMLVSDDLDRLRETHGLVRVVYAERPPDEELSALGALSGVRCIEREGRSVRLRVRGDVEAVMRTAEERPQRVLDVDATGMSLEDIYVDYVEGAGNGL